MFSGPKQVDSLQGNAASGDQSDTDTHTHHVPALISNDHSMNGTHASYVVASGGRYGIDIHASDAPAPIRNDHQIADNHRRTVVASGDHTIGDIQGMYVLAPICNDHVQGDIHVGCCRYKRGPLNRWYPPVRLSPHLFAPATTKLISIVKMPLLAIGGQQGNDLHE